MGESTTVRTRLALGGLLVFFLILATIYNATSTPFEAPDEVGHFYYVIYLLQERKLPVVPPEMPHPNYEHEGVQPPLYYAGAALFTHLLERPLRLDLDDAGEPLVGNPHSTCAQPDARYNVSYFSHDPHRQRFPYQGRIRVLHVIRLFSSLLGIATVLGVFAAVRLAFPETPVAAWLAAGLVAFLPEFLFTSGAATNDSLVTALSTWGVYLALRALRDGLRWRLTLALGLVAGLAALSKFSGALLLPLSLGVIFLTAILQNHQDPDTNGLSQQADKSADLQISKLANLQICKSAKSNGKLIIGHWSLVILVFLALTGWWFARNWTLYGDLTGTRPMLETLTLRQDMSVWRLFQELPGLFRSWWGVFGCTVPPREFYVPFVLLSLGGLAGLVADRRRLRQSWPQVAVLLAWLALMGVAYAQWNWIIHAAKGRLLYPAIVVVAGFLGRGWAVWSERWRGLAPVLLALLAVGAAVVPFTVMLPRVAPPPIYAQVEDVQPQVPLEGRFGDNIALVGYDLDHTSFDPGEWLDLTLYWLVLDAPLEHYVLAIQLVSAIPGDTATLINFNTWTGGGNYPTGSWRPGDVIADRYELQIPEDVPQAQGWTLQVVLFGLYDHERLPFTLNDTPAGDAAHLALLRVGATNPEEQAPPEADRLATPFFFGGAVALDGVRVTWGAEEVDVVFWWRSVAPLEDDAVVFVHLYDAEGRPLATADGPPLFGGFVTSLWQPGDRVRDERIIVASREEAGPLQLGVGWYDLVSGARLVATSGEDERLPHDEVLIPVPP